MSETKLPRRIIGLEEPGPFPRLFTMDDIRMAARMGVLEAARKTGTKVSVRDMEDIVDSVAKLILKKQPINQ